MIFALDVLSPLQGAVAVLYTIVVAMAARSHERAMTIVAASAGFAPTLIGYSVSHEGEPLGAPAIRLAVDRSVRGPV